MLIRRARRIHSGDAGRCDRIGHLLRSPVSSCAVLCCESDHVGETQREWNSRARIPLDEDKELPEAVLGIIGSRWYRGFDCRGRHAQSPHVGWAGIAASNRQQQPPATGEPTIITVDVTRVSCCLRSPIAGDGLSPTSPRTTSKSSKARSHRTSSNAETDLPLRPVF